LHSLTDSKKHEQEKKNKRKNGGLCTLWDRLEFKKTIMGRKNDTMEKRDKTGWKRRVSRGEWIQLNPSWEHERVSKQVADLDHQ
jgi:hypothetical protein